MYTVTKYIEKRILLLIFKKLCWILHDQCSIITYALGLSIIHTCITKYAVVYMYDILKYIGSVAHTEYARRIQVSATSTFP